MSKKATEGESSSQKKRPWQHYYSGVPPQELVFTESFIAPDELSRVLGSGKLEAMAGAP